MRYFLLLSLVIAMVTGCARDPLSPPSDSDNQLQFKPQASAQEGSYRLWGEWKLYFDANHENVDLVPVRNARFHLNALKFLESYCTDCVKLIKLKNNGNGTVDLTVQLTHPFPGLPQYTGFDVKGIMMFDGSYEFPFDSTKWHLPNPYFEISWREMGDPEVLNPDGYTPRWAPSWESGSDLPIFNYWKGKFAFGEPNADLNAFLDFYSLEERHIFLVNSKVNRTYTIWLPPGEPVVAGYAVEACWEPPTVTPVTNPIEDFPSSANQPEAYHFKVVVNEGEVITDCDEWLPGSWLCDLIYADIAQWGGVTSYFWFKWPPDGVGDGGPIKQCDPPVEGRFEIGSFAPCEFGNGTFRGVCVNSYFMNYHQNIAYTIFDWTVNDPTI
jgi:hypothetical protein